MKKILLEKIENLKNEILNQNEPWNDPILFRNAINPTTNKPYQGINFFLLKGGFYATFNQLKKENISIKKGSKSKQIFFYTFVEKEKNNPKDSKNPIKDSFPVLKRFNVFDVENDTQNPNEAQKLIEKYKQDNPPKSIEYLDKIIHQYTEKSELKIITKTGRACYNPKNHHVQMPPIDSFKTQAEYYATYFHELAHSTKKIKPRNLDYATEELVAELTSLLVLADTNLHEQQRKNALKYLKSWLTSLPKEKQTKNLAEALRIAKNTKKLLTHSE